METDDNVRKRETGEEFWERIKETYRKKNIIVSANSQLKTSKIWGFHSDDIWNIG